jgi:methanogenic corrinoid protein MtbC1
MRKAQSLADFYARLRNSATTGNPETAEEVLRQSIELGVRPLDLLIGVIQPILHEIGTLWLKGMVTVAIEHQFSAFSSAMIALIYFRYPHLQRYRQSNTPRFLLVNAEDNYHVLGLQLVELCLATHHIDSRMIVPGLPGSEVVRLVRELKPSAIGFSVALATQMKSIREVIACLQELDEKIRPRIIIGGNSVKEGMEPRPEFAITTFRTLGEFEQYLDSQIW